MEKEVRLTIAGSAGRGSDARFMKVAIYNQMVMMATSYLYDNGLKQVCSGGAAFGDHVAVSLAMQGIIPASSLILYFPERFDLHHKRFNGSPVGRTTNRYHDLFSRATNRDSLDEIAWCIQNGAKPVHGAGFQERNTSMALFPGSSGRLLAFTSGSLGCEKSPFILHEFGPNELSSNAGLKHSRGTADTWDKSLCPKAHIKIGIP